MFLDELAVGLDIWLRPLFFCGDGWRRVLSGSFLAELSAFLFELISLVRDRGSLFGLGALSGGLGALGLGAGGFSFGGVLCRTGLACSSSICGRW